MCVVEKKYGFEVPVGDSPAQSLGYIDPHMVTVLSVLHKSRKSESVIIPTSSTTLFLSPIHYRFLILRGQLVTYLVTVSPQRSSYLRQFPFFSHAGAFNVFLQTNSLANQLTIN